MLRALAKILKGVSGARAKIDDRRRLERLGRDEYKYSDGDKSLVLQIEMLTGSPQRLLYSSTIRSWLPPHADDVISPEERREIAERIARFLEQKGYRTEIA